MGLFSKLFGGGGNPQIRTAREISRAAANLATAAENESRELAEMAATTMERAREAESRRDELSLQMAAALIPELDPSTAARLNTLVGPVFLGRDDPQTAREVERRELQAELSTATADPRYVDRELLRTPGIGELTRKVDEYEEYAQPQRDILARAAHPRLERLLAAGYDQSQYQPRWWNLDYYRDWKAGDEILEKFPSKQRFSEVRFELSEARQSLEVLEPKLAELRTEIAAGEALEARVIEIGKLLETLDGRYLENARIDLIAFLQQGEMTEIGQRLEVDPPLAELYKMLRGHQAKCEYLLEVAAQIEQNRAKVLAMSTKAARDAVKWARPKRSRQTMSREDFERKYILSQEKMRKRREKQWHTVEVVHHYNDYNHVSFHNNFLWWDVMTDGRLDGNFIPQVQEFHQANPGWVYQRDDAEAAAMAIDPDSGQFDSLDAS